MKKKFLVFQAAISILLFSCNSSTPKDNANAADTTAATTSTETVAPPVFMPFDVVRVQFHVKDFDKWFAGFLTRDSARLANGIHKYVVDRGLGADSNMVMVISKIDDLQKAKAFYASAPTKAAMQKGGIIGAPKITYLHAIRSDTSDVPQAERVSVTHHVKNFDTWLKAYDGEGKDTRAANGLTDRSLARGMEDSNMVNVSFVVTDMAKAKARVASADLKKLMTDAGVDSAPEIIWYRLVQRF